MFKRTAALWSIPIVISLVVLAYPIYVIRPFRYQGPGELSVALAVTRFRPFFEIGLVIAALALLIWRWRVTRGILQKIFVSICFLLVAGCGVLSRVNVYELMFHPMGRPNFSPAAKAPLDGDEEVIAVVVNGAPRAYPIRSISYHHIVNDVLGGLPIVATY